MRVPHWMPDWITHRFLSRWVRVEVTDPKEIAKIKEEFGIEPREPPHVLLIDASEYGHDGPLPSDYSPGSWIEPKGKP